MQSWKVKLCSVLALDALRPLCEGSRKGRKSKPLLLGIVYREKQKKDAWYRYMDAKPPPLRVPTPFSKIFKTP